MITIKLWSEVTIWTSVKILVFFICPATFEKKVFKEILSSEKVDREEINKRARALEQEILAKKYASMDMKEKQLKIILENNPAEDDEHCWIRSVDDILTFEESMDSDGYEGYEEYAPDYTRTDAKEALRTGVIRVYSSKEI